MMIITIVTIIIMMINTIVTITTMTMLVRASSVGLSQMQTVCVLDPSLLVASPN